MSPHTVDELACCRDHFPDAAAFVSKDMGLYIWQIAAMAEAQQVDGIDRLACLDEQTNKRLPKTRYVEVTAHGELRIMTGTGIDRARFVKQGVYDGVCSESGAELTNFPPRWPVSAYGWFLLSKEDFASGGRRLNAMANAMVWELTGPVDPDTERKLRAEYGELTEPSSERVKSRFRGNVVFHATLNVGLDDEQLGVVECAHRTAVQKLRAKGWLK